MSDDVADAIAMRLVQNEVLVCISHLVSSIAAVAHMTGQGRAAVDAIDLGTQALELCEPVYDPDTAAEMAGWSKGTDGLWVKADEAETFVDVSDLCFHCDLEPYQWEVFEHWVVSDWLAAKLLEHGEKVDTDFAGLNVWARTTTGQAIHADGVFNAIARGVAGGPTHE